MGIQVAVEYRDPKYLPEQTPEYKLSVLIGVDSLCFEVFESRTHRSLLLQEYLFNATDADQAVREIFENSSPLHSSNYLSVKIGFSSGACSLIPRKFFETQNLSAYWQGVSALPEGYQAIADSITALDANLLWTIPTAIQGYFLEYHPGCRYFHSASAWLTSAYQIAKTTAQPVIFAHLAADQVFLATFDASSLVFFNRFTWKSTKDFLYFTLLSLHQSGFAAERTRLVMSGKLTPDSEIIRLLQRYFPELEMAQSPMAVAYPDNLPKAQYHWYFDLAGFRWF